MIEELLSQVVHLGNVTPPKDFTPFCQNRPEVISRWSPSSLDVLQTCPRKYYYSKVERWTSKEFSAAQWFGQCYHAGIEAYRILTISGYSHEAAVVQCMKMLIDEWDKLDVSPWPDNTRGLEQLCRAVLWYIDDAEKSSYGPVIRSDGTPAVELGFLIELPLKNPDGENYVLYGIVDELAQLKEDVRNKLPVVRDRKSTGAQLNDQYFAQFKPSNQTAGYAVAGSVAFEGQPFSVMIEGCQTMVGGTRFQNRLIEYRPPELDEWLKDTMYWIQQAEAYAEQAYWPMNRTSCTKLGGCDFQEVCSKSPAVRHIILNDAFQKLPSVWEGAAFRALLSYITVPGVS